MEFNGMKDNRHKREVAEIFDALQSLDENSDDEMLGQVELQITNYIDRKQKTNSQLGGHFDRDLFSVREYIQKQWRPYKIEQMMQGKNLEKIQDKLTEGLNTFLDFKRKQRAWKGRLVVFGSYSQQTRAEQKANYIVQNLLNEEIPEDFQRNLRHKKNPEEIEDQISTLKKQLDELNNILGDHTPSEGNRRLQKIINETLQDLENIRLKPKSEAPKRQGNR